MEQKRLRFNLPQLLTVVAPQKNKHLLWGRGTGKSTIIAWQMKELAFNLPRAQMSLVGETYGQILTRTLPSTIGSLERLGYVSERDFWVGKKPPKKFNVPDPLEPPKSYDHFLQFRTGAGFHLISQDRPGSGRGINSHAVIGDEMQLLDFEKLQNDVLFTNRAGLNYFPDTKYLNSTFFCGTIPWTQKGKWVYKREDLAKEDPSEYFFLRASALENMANLGMKWFKDIRRNSSDLIYNTEILNIQPDRIEGGFYPALSDKIHEYTSYNYGFLENLNYDFKKLVALTWHHDGDIQKGEPLDVACDWGASINCMSVGQYHEPTDEFRFLNSPFVLAPDKISHLANKFCDYYEGYPTRYVRHYHDHTAIGTDAVRTVTFKEEFETVLRNRGWVVESIYIGQAPGHHTKYLFWGVALDDEDERLPSVRFNSNNAKYLLISMKQAPVKQGSKGFEKDKSSEQKDKKKKEGQTEGQKQEEATHLSDSADTLLFGKFRDRMDESSSVFTDHMMG